MIVDPAPRPALNVSEFNFREKIQKTGELHSESYSGAHSIHVEEASLNSWIYTVSDIQNFGPEVLLSRFGIHYKWEAHRFFNISTIKAVVGWKYFIMFPQQWGVIEVDLLTESLQVGNVSPSLHVLRSLHDDVDF